jgi:hypothetical protein
VLEQLASLANCRASNSLQAAENDELADTVAHPSSSCDLSTCCTSVQFTAVIDMENGVGITEIRMRGGAASTQQSKPEHIASQDTVFISSQDCILNDERVYRFRTQHSI